MHDVCNKKKSAARNEINLISCNNCFSQILLHCMKKLSKILWRHDAIFSCACNAAKLHCMCMKKYEKIAPWPQSFNVYGTVGSVPSQQNKVSSSVCYFADFEQVFAYWNVNNKFDIDWLIFNVSFASCSQEAILTAALKNNSNIGNMW